MDEKFSISLELALNKWKSQMATVKKSMQDIGKVAKSSIAIDDSSIKNMTAQQELLKKKIIDIQQTLVMAQQDTKLFSPSEVLEMRAELEKLESQLNDTTKSSTAFKKVGDNISDTMKKGMQSAKRFTLSLFGIHSIYRMLSRASSAYLAQDQETTNKIQAAWIGLGSVFAPLLQMIADFAIKAVSYLNIFIKAFTGLDFLGNAMAKSMGGANKSAGKLSKTLAGFDEITNLDSDAGNVGAGTEDWTSAFKKVELDPNLARFFENLGEKLKPVKDDLGKIALTLLGVFTGAKLLSILAGIGGIAGIAGLAAIAVAEIAAAIWLAIYANDELNYIKERNIELDKQNLKQTQDFTKAMRDALAQGNLTLEQAKVLNKTALQDIDNMIERNKLTTIDSNERKINNAIIQEQIDNLMYSAYHGKLDGEERKRLITILESQRTSLLKANEGLNKNSKEYQENSKKVNQLEKDLKGLTGTDYNTKVKVDVDTTSLNSKLKSVGARLAQLVTGNFSISGSFSGGMSGGGFAKGLDVVPFDGMYKLHRNETVVPAKFTPSMHGLGNGGNQELLSEIRAMREDIQRIEINPYTTIKDVGTASVDYINKQNRIMGRGVI